MTNQQIHELVTPMYKRYTCKAHRPIKHRVGYSVRWETGVYTKNTCVEHDCAGYMSKRDAMHLGELLVKDGYMGVRVYCTYNIDFPSKSWDGEAAVLSEDSPEMYQVAHSAVANELDTMRELGLGKDSVMAHRRAVDNACYYAEDAHVPIDVLKAYLERWWAVELTKQQVAENTKVSA